MGYSNSFLAPVLMLFLLTVSIPSLAVPINVQCSDSNSTFPVIQMGGQHVSLCSLGSFLLGLEVTDALTDANCSFKYRAGGRGREMRVVTEFGVWGDDRRVLWDLNFAEGNNDTSWSCNLFTVTIRDLTAEPTWSISYSLTLEQVEELGWHSLDEKGLEWEYFRTHLNESEYSKGVDAELEITDLKLLPFPSSIKTEYHKCNSTARPEMGPAKPHSHGWMLMAILILAPFVAMCLMCAVFHCLMLH